LEDRQTLLNEFIIDLDSKMWKTRGSRYNADRRLKRKSNLSLATISLLSFYVLIISIVSSFSVFNLNNTETGFLTFISIVISIFIIVLSLLEASKEYSIKAERLYTCANEINRLMSELKFAQATITEIDKLEKEVYKIHNEYQLLIKNVKENHDDIDFDLFRVANKKKPMKQLTKDLKQYEGEFEIGGFEILKIYTKLALHYSLYYICIFGPLIILVISTFILNDAGTPAKPVTGG